MLQKFLFKNNYDLRNFTFIIIYCTIFLILRLTASTTGMTLDEAELFIDASQFKLGFDDQPPLYSWIIKSFSFIFGLNVPLMVCVNQILICVFFCVIYSILRLLYERKTAELALLSYVFIFLYSYDFYRYMIHTTLMVVIAALGFWVFLKLLYRPRPAYYAVFGALMALGILAKYNFIFFVLLIFVSSLFNKLARRRFLNKKTFLFLIFFTLILLPHLIWLYQDDFQALKYTLKRGDSGDLNQNILQVLLDFFWQPLLYLMIVGAFFFKDIKFSLPQRRKELSKFLLVVLIFAYLIPLLAILAFKFGNFSQRWLAPVNFLLPIVFFGFVPKTTPQKGYKVVCFFVISIILLVKLLAFHFPDLYQKTIFIHIPHKKIYTELKKEFNSDSQICVYKDLLLFAGLKSLDPDLKITFSKKTICQDFDLLVWNVHDKRVLGYLTEIQKEKIKVLKIPYEKTTSASLYKIKYLKK